MKKILIFGLLLAAAIYFVTRPPGYKSPRTRIAESIITGLDLKKDAFSL
jgi:hypothetical protein